MYRQLNLHPAPRRLKVRYRDWSNCWRIAKPIRHRDSWCCALPQAFTLIQSASNAALEYDATRLADGGWSGEQLLTVGNRCCGSSNLEHGAHLRLGLRFMNTTLASRPRYCREREPIQLVRDGSVFGTGCQGYRYWAEVQLCQ